MAEINKENLYKLIKEVMPNLHTRLKEIWKSGDLDQISNLEDDFVACISMMQGYVTSNDQQPAGIQDDEAEMLLAEMDAPLEENNDDKTMDDDEAAMLLAEMDAPLEENSDDKTMDDDEAAMLLAEMDAPLEENSDDTTMDDDEAAMLLAEMDAPLEEKSADTTMDDDEAAMLLAEMEQSNTSSDYSADDEAAALLAELEDEDGLDMSSQEPAIGLSNLDTDEGNVEEVGEIEEFGGSEFASDPDMMNDFITNSSEIMESLDEHILALEADPSSKEVIEEIFRGAHTLKGAAGMFGFKAIERIMHRMENYFDLIRKDKLTANPDAIDLILESMDALRVLVEAVSNNEPSGLKTAPLVIKLNDLCAGKYIKQENTSKQSEKVVTDVQPVDKTSKKPTKQKKDVSTIRVDLERLDVLVNLVGELVIDRTRFMAIEENLRTNFSDVDLTSNMSETLLLFGRHMNEIQDIIMKVRMVPIGNAFNKFNRIVRDIARQLDKEIELDIFGEDTELDKTLVEQIGDPLVHLIRNACDHGAETMSQRKAAGKSGPARIELSARQEGNHIVISIEDDGKGINPEIIRAKAIEKGLISEEDKLSNKEIFNLIFEPGFSTATEVTNISGRGVGMDVVKKQISKLKGIIDIDSTEGFGTSISIQLPLTLAIVQSLLVKTSGDVFAIPLSTVVESIRISPDEIQVVGDAEVIKRRDEILPLVHLSEALQLEQKQEEFWYGNNMTVANATLVNRQEERKKGRLFVVVVGTGERKFGIVVDHLLYQQEMVIKPMGKIMQDIPCVAGGAILGNGEVVLVLEVQEIEQHTRGKMRISNAAA